jgi:ATP-dependent protease ClpP protease subunit
MLFGTIGADFWGEGVTAAGFDEALKALGNVSTIRLRANSGGGDVFEATAIYNMLVKHPANLIVEIEGVAASAMTLIAMAGDEIHISENAHFMIHRASGFAYGNSDDLKNYLKLLDNADSLIRLTYSKRTGLSDSELVKLMDHDNWMTAEEALDLGFVDEVDDAKTVEPHISPAKASAKPRPVSLDSERIAAWTESLNVLRIAASATHTGDSPQSVSPSPKEPKKMNAKLRAKCIAAGMAESLTGDAADKWLEDNFDKVFGVTGTTTAVADPPKDLDAILDAREKKATEARKAWKAEVKASLELAFGDSIPNGLQSECEELQADGITAVRAKILEAKKTKPEETLRIRFSDSQPRDRHIDAIKAGVQVRALAGLAEKHLPTKDRPKDHERFSQMPLIRIAEQCLLVDGFSYDQVNRLSGPQIAMAAMGFHQNAGIRADGLHTTGSLLEITKDAMNKSLTSAYSEAPQTWRGPFRQASSVPDFKTKHVIKLSALGNLPVWVDGNPPEQGKFSNEREAYAVEARAENISFSWKLLVNDDMDALSRTPQLLGNAAARTVNATVWRELTSNPVLADGKALFLETPAGNRKRKNLTTGSATPTNTTITAMRTLMRLMRGLNTPEGNESEDILNLTPTYLMAPVALEGVVTQQLGSEADPAASGNAGILNLSRYWGLIPVFEPLLDASSTTAWYLGASPSLIDTIEISFLQGQESPVTMQYMDEKTMAQNFTIIQTYAAKAIDHRGLQKHDGA